MQAREALECHKQSLMNGESDESSEDHNAKRNADSKDYSWEFR
jgi:hypothetical protein